MHSAESVFVRAVIFYEVVKGFLTGSTPDVGEMHQIER